MKTLLILRHADSSWNDPRFNDHERPLNERGRSDAPRVGSFLVERELIPDRIVSSTARRAVQTAKLVADAFRSRVEVEQSGSLYLAPPEGYAKVVAQGGGSADRLMLVGHNPGVSALATYLTGESVRMPTAGLAVVESPVDDWADLRLTTRGRLRGFWHPTEIDVCLQR